MYLLSKVCDPDGEGFRTWYIEVEYDEETGEKRCKVTCPEWDPYNGDYTGDYTKITVHSEILSDDWKVLLKNFVEEKR